MAQCLYQFDDGLTTLYDSSIGAATTPGHIQYNGIGRLGVRVDSGASGLNSFAKSVWVFFRKNGNSIGNITLRVRKAADLVILVVVLAQHVSIIISSESSSDGGHHGTG
jgi:hypothetical protein